MVVPVTNPDPEPVLIRWLQSELEQDWPGVWVDRAMPATTKPLVVTVQRAGGVGSGPLDTARLLINVWAPDEHQANQLAAAVRTVMDYGCRPPLIAHARCNGPTAINTKGDNPQRLMYGHVIIRREHTA